MDRFLQIQSQLSIGMYGLMYTKHDHLYTSVASKDLDLLLQFKASGLICRSATNECDITEYCTGTSGEVCVYVRMYMLMCMCMCMCM